MVSTRPRAERRGRARAIVMLVVALVALLTVAAGMFAAWRFLGDVEASRASLAARERGAEPLIREQPPSAARVDSPLPPMPEDQGTTPDRIEVDASLVLRVLVVDAQRQPVEGIPVALGQVGGHVDHETLIARSGRDGV